MWILFLNPMMGRAEERSPVARAETREALIAFLEREAVESYSERGIGTYGYSAGEPYTWAKAFRKGGPLEWYNAPLQLEEAIIDAGTVEDRVARLRAEWEAECARIPDVGIGQ